MARPKRRRRRRMTAKQRMYFGKRRGAPRRRKRRAFAHNPVRRRRRSYAVHHRRRRSYSHNPPGLRSIAGELGWAGAGFMTTKVVGNFVTPMVAGFVGDQPIMRIAVKLGVAYISAWGLSVAMGSKVFAPAMIGGSMSAIQDAVATFIAPTFPMLADYGGMGIYVESPRMMPAVRGRRGGVGEYYHMGDGLSPDHDSIV